MKDYFFASWIGMLPGTLLYVYIGSLGGEVAALGTAEQAKTPLEWALYAVGLIVTVVVTVFVTRIAKRALQEAISSSAPRSVEGELRAQD